MMDRLTTLVLSALARTQEEEGQSMAEYAMVLALIAIAVVTALGVLSGGISAKFDSIANAL